AAEGEDLGSSIEGTMASIQEQLKHIRMANDDWYDEHRRLIGELTQLSRRTTPDRRSLASTPQLERLSSFESRSGERSS
ncbi:hypothetical protein KXX11_007233, partial [Aspergillus fumigatus]